MDAIKQAFSALQERWLARRIPVNSRYTLNLRNVFIFPSRFGFGFSLTCVGLFILGTNYQNNLMLLLCNFLLAMFLLHLFVSYKNFTAIAVTLKDISPVFANEHATLTLQVHTEANKNPFYGGLHLQLKGTKFGILHRRADRDNAVKLTIPAGKRGIYHLPRLTVSSTYPLGLFRCWTHVDFARKLTVYPAPIASDVLLSTDYASHGETSGSARGIDEFDALRAFKLGDPMHRIAWKQAAKGGELATKTFVQTQQEGGWLSLDTYANEPRERALGLLSYQVKRLSEHQHIFGLKLGNKCIEPSSGESHKHQCLACLASYQSEERPFATH